MGKIFVGQTKLTMKLDTGNLLLLVDVAKIKFKKGDDTLGEWTATVSGRHIFYDIASVNDIDVSGLWDFYAHILYDDATIIIGEKVSLKIYNPGE